MIKKITLLSLLVLMFVAQSWAAHAPAGAGCGAGTGAGAGEGAASGVVAARALDEAERCSSTVFFENTVRAAINFKSTATIADLFKIIAGKKELPDNHAIRFIIEGFQGSPPVAYCFDKNKCITSFASDPQKIRQFQVVVSRSLYGNPQYRAWLEECKRKQIESDEKFAEGLDKWADLVGGYCTDPEE